MQFCGLCCLWLLVQEDNMANTKRVKNTVTKRSIGRLPVNVCVCG